MSLRERRNFRLSVFPDEVGGVGGHTITMLSNGALKIGDVVSLVSAGHVGKTNVAADMTKFFGVVVGGGSAFGADTAIYGTETVGLAATTAAEQAVVIQVNGIAYVVSDAAVAAAAILTQGGTTAGRVLGAGAAGQIIGVAIDAAGGAAATIRMKIQPR